VRRGAALESSRGHPCCHLNGLVGLRPCELDAGTWESVCGLACGGELLRPAASGDPLQAGARGRGCGWLVVRHGLSVRPLPPPGLLAFICSWPGRGIRTSRMEVDGGAVRAAADAAVTLWPDDPYCGDD
jgi:hypothetical protein